MYTGNPTRTVREWFAPRVKLPVCTRPWSVLATARGREARHYCIHYNARCHANRHHCHLLIIDKNSMSVNSRYRRVDTIADDDECGLYVLATEGLARFVVVRYSTPYCLPFFRAR